MHTYTEQGTEVLRDDSIRSKIYSTRTLFVTDGCTGWDRDQPFMGAIAPCATEHNNEMYHSRYI